MKTSRRPACGLAGIGLALAVLSGCQTNTAGMTLPSPHYMNHPPQFIPQSPAFPLRQELAQQEAIAAAAGQPGAPQALPAPVPAGPPPGGILPPPGP